MSELKELIIVQGLRGASQLMCICSNSLVHTLSKDFGIWKAITISEKELRSTRQQYCFNTEESPGDLEKKYFWIHHYRTSGFISVFFYVSSFLVTLLKRKKNLTMTDRVTVKREVCIHNTYLKRLDVKRNLQAANGSIYFVGTDKACSLRQTSQLQCSQISIGENTNIFKSELLQLCKNDGFYVSPIPTGNTFRFHSKLDVELKTSQQNRIRIDVYYSMIK